MVATASQAQQDKQQTKGVEIKAPAWPPTDEMDACLKCSIMIPDPKLRKQKQLLRTLRPERADDQGWLQPETPTFPQRGTPSLVGGHDEANRLDSACWWSRTS
ncbi:hypothetical protein PG985_004770 [Apiospora marii]|uniref:Uncharacterized protein n=1 Tax=Apiospora marii TaxID=335849 RepID=A0ABR1SA92_9PEZI